MANIMSCKKCKGEFLEWQMDESHDVPCYLFDGDSRREKKQQADKFGRRYLCKECHLKYENDLKLQFRIIAKQFANKYFGGDD